MSIKLMSQVWEMSGFDGPTEKLVLLCLADFADDDGECWPKIATVAHKANCSEIYVRKLVQKWEKSGLLRVERVPGRGRASRYFLCLEGQKTTQKPIPENPLSNIPITNIPIPQAVIPIPENPLSGIGPYITTKRDNHQEPPERDAREKTREKREISPPENLGTCPNSKQSETDRRPFIEGQNDPRFGTPFFAAVCAVCQVGPEATFKMRCRASVAAVTLEGAGFSPDDVALAGSRWAMPTAPTPEQLTDSIRRLLNQKPTSNPPNANHPTATARANASASGQRETAYQRGQREQRELRRELGI